MVAASYCFLFLVVVEVEVHLVFVGVEKKGLLFLLLFFLN
jgi:hypothetical protein